MSEKNERKKYILLPTYAKNAANKRKPYSLTQIYIQKCTILLLFQYVFTVC